MADKYLRLYGAQIKELEATVLSTGVGSAGDILALNENGRLDNSIMMENSMFDNITVRYTATIGAETP
ncbi:MAG: hypothetical protein DRQ47_11085, partial [Gammaproteobacteria bacterium]